MAELRTVTWMDGNNGPYSQEIDERDYDAFVASHAVVDNVESDDVINARLDEESAGTYTRNSDGTFTRNENVEIVTEPAEASLYVGAQRDNNDVPADQNIADYPGAVPGPDQANTSDPNATIRDTPVFDDTARRSNYTPPPVQ